MGIVDSIEQWWMYTDKKAEDPSQVEWYRDYEQYLDDMEVAVQRYADANPGDPQLGGITEEQITDEIYKPDRILTKEEVLWGVRGHWEDDFLDPA